MLANKLNGKVYDKYKHFIFSFSYFSRFSTKQKQNNFQLQNLREKKMVSPRLPHMCINTTRPRIDRIQIT